MVALGERALDFDGALRRLQRAVELDEERVADGFDLRAVEAREQTRRSRRCSSSNSCASCSLRWDSAL